VSAVKPTGRKSVPGPPEIRSPVPLFTRGTVDKNVAPRATQPAHLTDGHLASAISTMVVRVMRTHTGRGPTKARTNLSDEVIWVVVENMLTHAERTLIAYGRTELVLRVRKSFQEIMRADLIAGVETLSGRTVSAFFSDNTLDPDVAVQLFLLAPQAGADDPRPGNAAAWRAFGSRGAGQQT
jgi:uncharacterized protein YbcI